MSTDPAPSRPDDAASAYARLSPDTALDCLEALGYVSDGRILELNSYENRVLRVGMEDGPPVVAKFYRPGRWSDAAIREEHALCAELTAAEITDTAPLAAADGETLHRVDEYRIALYPCVGGRAPELE
ncbi:MAG: phosphotransferase, partial [Gammaproteobacteria bacterium]|nr:phosphotransferase [Gammaproteobacteria bacterium]